MPNENEREDVQKAMACDLLKIFKENSGKTYSYEEPEALIDAYISELKQWTKRGRARSPAFQRRLTL